jgi:hypothetical protein
MEIKETEKDQNLPLSVIYVARRTTVSVLFKTITFIGIIINHLYFMAMRKMMLL